ncbi:hypothetical protein K491DRAFT_693174 [Lophiostoma macrostomum CBS 122681]|uniref:NB-ARC domain-containing protein n=1 Tax=Lophiostoma macrostomum CBS 122681 TaxID=1314788 RepID=A0A6A6T562_9PLEO|nr:hypothetical protein K491DRAFT_693174 [Lophiostoma macrostomum CBS 122681]
MPTRKKGPVFRVTGLPAAQPDDELDTRLRAVIVEELIEDEPTKLDLTIAIVPSCYDNEDKTALIEFHGGVPTFLSGQMDNPLGDWQAEIGDTDVSFDCHFFGFTQLYTPTPNVPVTADIIAITGLDGHAYGSWRGKGNLGRMWLRDFLSKDLPCCRTMIYGYNSKLTSHGVDTIMDYGRGLVEELKKVRRTEELRKRPLFFITHSFGGIILAQCLVKAIQAGEDDHPTIASLHKATYGMLLFGIPHKGLLVDDIQKMLAGQENHPRSTLLQQITSKSDLLANQLVDFKNLIRDRKVVSFYETGQSRQLEFNHDTKRWKRTGDFITAVDADSALLHLPDHVEEKIPLETDHSMIVKFDARNTRGYTSARDKLRQYEQDAPHVVADRFSRDNREQSFAVVVSLFEASETNHFVAREAELAKMHEALTEGTSRRAVTLHGLGGMGKTQLAIAYTKAHRGDYSAILWLNIKDEVSVKQSYLRIAKRILQDCPSASELGVSTDEKDQDGVVAAVIRWLEQAKNTKWLMVFDNYDNPKLLDNDNEDPGVDNDDSANVPGNGNVDHPLVNIQQFLPEADHGSVIVTTRTSQVSIGRQVKVGKLGNPRDSLQILSDASQRDGVMDDPHAIRLAEELDGLPLALATAGAYLHEVATSFAEYLHLYQKSWEELHKTSPKVSTYDRRLYSTWRLSLDQVKRQSEVSSKLLQLWAYFDNQDVWFELLRAGRRDGPRWLCQLTENVLSFNQAVRVLCNYGLIELDKSSERYMAESQGYGLHGCVHAWTTHVVNQEWDAEMARVALMCVGWGISAMDSWLTHRRHLPHLTRCWKFVMDGSMDVDGMDRILHNFGYVCSSQGRFEEAEKMYLRALQDAEKHGANARETLRTVGNLGIVYTDLNRYKEAEKMLLRALQGREKVLGPDDRETLASANSLGILYAKVGQLNEAEKMYLRVLQGQENVEKQDDAFMLNAVDNLGIIYTRMERFEAAEQMYLRALSGYEKALGPEAVKTHISTLNAAQGMGFLFWKTGRTQEAEEWYLRALQGYEKALGQELVKTHIPALDATENMAVLLWTTGRIQEAEVLYEEALSGFEVAKGRTSDRYREIAEILEEIRSTRE